MDSFSRSWSLLKESWAVLKENKTLAVFPILSGIACVLVLATFVGSFFAIPGLSDILDKNQQQQDQTARIVMGVLVFCYYVVNYFVIVFFNTALVSCAIMHFHGQKPTFGDGLRAAMARLPQILGWAVLAATVGMILRAIEERSEFVGKLVADLLGLAWTAITYLVVPVLAVEKLGPIAATKRSAQLLKECWGEGLIGNFRLGLIGFLCYIPGLLLLVAGFVLGMAGGQPNLPVLFTLAGIGILYLVTVAIILSTLKQIYVAGLYMYAAEQQIPQEFSPDLLQGAFRQK
jgi:hypothetical protein